MQMEYEKCLEIIFHSNARIEPTLVPVGLSVADCRLSLSLMFDGPHIYTKWHIIISLLDLVLKNLTILTVCCVKNAKTEIFAVIPICGHSV